MDQPERRLFIAVPCYSGEISYATHFSIERAKMDCAQRGWTVDVVFRFGDSVITRARNFLFSTFLTTDCTHLLFLDADIGCRPGTVPRLMDHPVDIVGAAYPHRGEPESFIFRSLPGDVKIDPETHLLEVEGIATGFMLIKRAAAEKIRDAFADRWFVDGTCPNLEKVYCVFDFELKDGQYFTEDYVFCRRWREIGGRLWLDPVIELDHLGSKVYRGALWDYMQKFAVPDPLAEPPSLAAAVKKIIAESEQAA